MKTLNEIIEAKYEPEILTFLLLAPPRAFYSDEIAIRLGINRLKVEEILNGMTASGQVLGFQKKGKKYYLLQHSFKPFAELRSALIKDRLKYEDEFYVLLAKLKDVKAVFLSGLLVGNLEAPVDMLLVGKVNADIFKKVLEALEKMMGQELNYSIMTEEEYWLRQNTFDKFMKELFDYSHLTVFNNLKSK